VGGGFYFVTWEAIIKKMWSGPRNKAPAFLAFLAGVISGIVGWIVVYPLDLIKTTIQADSLKEPKILSTKMAIMNIHNSKPGLRKWYTGFLPCVVRTIPTAGATLLVYLSTLNYIETHLEKA
jgi:solute carrier family 25 carnitine/acylcarnitine transporter 20/29